MPAPSRCSPDDSIEHLQRLITESGWGQIPVVDPESGRDHRHCHPHRPAQDPDAKRPAARRQQPGRAPGSQPCRRPPGAAAGHRRAAHEQHAALYIVGGFVRDLLLERPSLDFDLVVEGDAIALARALARPLRRAGDQPCPLWHRQVAPGRTRPDGKPSNLSMSGLQSIDLVSARTEFYTHPTALPTVERGSIKLDLHRRDFTINTLALRLDGRHYGELHDYWGGLDDLRQRVVRVLHSLSFVDDPTRMLRAVRFEQRFGFSIEARTHAAAAGSAPVDRAPVRRSYPPRAEPIYSIPRWSARSWPDLDSLGMLAAIHPELVWDDWLE